MKALEKNAIVISAILAKLLDIGINTEMVNHVDFKLDEEFLDTVEPCMNWLANEGIVTWSNTAHTMGSWTWLGPTLTSRGIAIMGAKLEVDGKSVTVAEYVVQPKNQNRDFSAIGDFLGSAIGGFAKSMSS
ncbi:hypothetical protein KO498_17245 [Lentibacter algarum]|uniref:hypothetical protein n=1 Tax=Lentibacter algarum TaxID=576131 RepID=UPI001C098EC7|nr:hypothetical protein [Lentibacter algarum]MBU2983556.1 hypothetical protein [Lentibacter algarum]